MGVGHVAPRYFQLRGIGENDQWQGAPNPSVGFLIDGIDFSGVGMPATLFDVAQIEVLRGPQGAIHGANALAGLINLRTRAPQPDAERRIELTRRRLRDCRAGRGAGRRARRRARRGRRGGVSHRRAALPQRRISPKRVPRPGRHQRLRRNDAARAAERDRRRLGPRRVAAVGRSRQWLRRLRARQLARHAV
ncbi:hypothetical protein EZJ55_24520 [Microcystis aeruginosa EAWAG127a]|uniref:TonB-dependent receptor plug domain-containing protein n=1 Tax=Microcystis aeruginosa EAWAG127a TaxID=2529855 RepID=A0A5J5LPN0_MICAE|nr:hypothetical protein EZJ55_24520 [Microcystis aeruginosa EAWAG127a]